MKKTKPLSLDPAQRKAAYDINGPVLIYAGAGAGKTRVIAARVAILLDKGVPPDEILCITFTNKAAEEMKQRISRYACRDVSEMWIGTFHAICSKILRKYGGDSNFTIYDGADSLSAVRRAMGTAYIDLREYPPGDILREISCYKRSILSDEFLDNLKSRHGDRSVELFNKAFDGYRKELEKSKALDFDDLLLRTILILRESQSVLDSVSGGFKYVLIDEYHDTAEIESVLVNLLTIKHGNLCVVADPKQSIYRFRGSDCRIATRFPQDHKGTSIYILDINYRSVRQIVSASEKVIQGGTEKMPYMTTANRKENGIVSILHYRNDTEEAYTIASEMKRLHNKKIRYSSMAVLCRTNSLAQSIVSALMQNGIPHQILNDNGFFSQREIRYVINYLRLIMNPKDDNAVEYILKMNGHGIGSRTINKLRGDGILITCGRSSKPCGISTSAWAALHEFHNTVIHITLMAHLGRPISEIIDHIIHETAWKEMESQNLEDLKTLSSRHTSPAIDTIPGFLEMIALTDSSGISETIQDKVRVMTIHQSKGLEFPVVFMLGVEEGLLPHIRSSCVAEIEEERRLCYVGMTRAVDRLYMSCVDIRHNRQAEPSRFLKEIDMR